MGGAGALPDPGVCCLAPGVPSREGRIFHRLAPQFLCAGGEKGRAWGRQLGLLSLFLVRGFPPGGHAHWGGSSLTLNLFACFNHCGWGLIVPFRQFGQVCKAPAGVKEVGVRWLHVSGVAWIIVDCYILESRELSPFPRREHRDPAQALKSMAVFYPGSSLRGKLLTGFLSMWLPVVLRAWPFVALMGAVDGWT